MGPGTTVLGFCSGVGGCGHAGVPGLGHRFRERRKQLAKESPSRDERCRPICGLLQTLPVPKPAIVLSTKLSSSFSFASSLLCPAATSRRRAAVPVSVNASSLLSHKSHRLPVNPGKRCRDSAPAGWSWTPPSPRALGRARGKRDDVTHPAAASRRRHGPPDLPRSGAAPRPVLTSRPAEVAGTWGESSEGAVAHERCLRGRSLLVAVAPSLCPAPSIAFGTREICPTSSSAGQQI